MTPMMFDTVTQMMTRQKSPLVQRSSQPTFGDVTEAITVCIQEALDLAPSDIQEQVFCDNSEDLTPGTRLYHGTTTHALSCILEQGIRPRDESSVGNHPDMPSLPGFTYLTQTQALCHAIHTASKLGTDPVIVEINAESLDRGRIYPDEDYLLQAWEVAKFLRRLGQGASVSTEVRMEVYHCAEVLEQDARVFYESERNVRACQSLWRFSLNRLGSIAYDGQVPQETIRRVAVLNGTTATPLMLLFGERMTFDIINTLFHSRRLVGLVRHIFDCTTFVPEWDEPAFLCRLPREKLRSVREIKKQMRQEHRKCVRVFTPGDAPLDFNNNALFGSKEMR